jgi:hypothetical protein
MPSIIDVNLFLCFFIRIIIIIYLNLKKLNRQLREITRFI